jgi:hypothetical protein
MGITVVFSLAYNNVEAGKQRTFRLQINDADGQEITPPLDASFTLPTRIKGVPTSVPLEAAFAIQVAGNVPILPEAGNYVIELLVDGNHVRSLPFSAIAPVGAPDESS